MPDMVEMILSGVLDQIDMGFMIDLIDAFDMIDILNAICACATPDAKICSAQKCELVL